MALKTGIQLYSVREHMAKDPVETIKEVVAAGYTNAEAANGNALTDTGVGFGVDAEEMNALMKRCGFRIISAHVSPLNDDNIGRVLEYNLAIGNRTLVDAFGIYASVDDVLRKAEQLEKIGEACRKAGARFLYHNHFQEFYRFGDKTIYDILLTNTSPENVGLELDTYWAMRGGADPIQLIEQNAGRIKMLHQKDWSRSSQTPRNLFDLLGSKPALQSDFGKVCKEEDFAEIGSGRMDIQRIIDAANAAGGIEYLILEQDFSSYDEIASIRMSMEGLKRFSGITLC